MRRYILNASLLLCLFLTKFIAEAKYPFSFIKKPRKKRRDNSKQQIKQVGSTHTKTKDLALQYSFIDGDIPLTRSTASSDALCVAICNPELLQRCHFDRACLLSNHHNKHPLQPPHPQEHQSSQSKSPPTPLPTCLQQCTSNAIHTVDLTALRKAQLLIINTIKRKSKQQIDSSMHTKLTNKKFLWATVIVRNSAQKLIEWIVHHFLLGVQHFLVYDNVSVDNLQAALQPFVQASVVTLIPNVRDLMQIKAYNHALQHAKQRSVQWLMMMDVDEFIMTSTTNTLLELLFTHTNTHTVGAVQLQWQLIVPPSPRGFLFKPANITYLELLTDSFAAKGYTHPKCSTKSIVKVDATSEVHVHYGKFPNISHTSLSASASTPRTAARLVPVRGIDVFGRPIDTPWAQKPCTGFKAVYVAHLLVGTLTDWIMKRENGYALYMKNGCKTCTQGFEAQVAEWQCQLQGGAMRRKQAYFEALNESHGEDGHLLPAPTESSDTREDRHHSSIDPDQFNTNIDTVSSQTDIQLNTELPSPISVKVPECFPKIKGYMTLKGLDVHFTPKPNTELEVLHAGEDALQRLQLMKTLLVLPLPHDKHQQKQWLASLSQDKHSKSRG